MSRATVIIDGETLLDQDLNQWQQQPPSFLAELADRKTKPAPYMQAVSVALAGALIRSLPVTIDVRTDHLGWAMTVTHDVDEHSRDGIR
jgi:hypothetical protein